MVKKKLEWISLATLIMIISVGIISGTIALGAKKNEKVKRTSKNHQQNIDDKADEKLAKKSDDENLRYKDGVYEGSAYGYCSDISLEVTIESDKIRDIEIISHDETPDYFEDALAVIDDIISYNTTDVDNVSGATATADAFKEAVDMALEKAEIKKDSKDSKSKDKKKKAKKKGKKKAKASKNRPARSQGVAGSRSVSSFGSSQGGQAGKNKMVSGDLKDGTYYGSAPGFNGNINVQVTIADGKIGRVDILSHNDDDPYFSNAASLLNSIVGRTNADVEAVSGATYSSYGIINAVNDALGQAISGDKTKDSSQKARINPKDKETSKSKTSPKKSSKAKNKKKSLEDKENKEDRHKEKESETEDSYQEGDLVDGEFTGTGTGFNGSVNVSVTIRDGKIEKVNILSHSDDYLYFDRAKTIIKSMIGNSSAKVDTVSGATYSSYGIINAVEDALEKSRAKNPKKAKKKSEKKESSGKKEFGNKTSKDYEKLPNYGYIRPPRYSNNEKPSENPNAGETSKPSNKLADGMYEGSAQGYKSQVRVQVEIKDGKISKVNILGHGEDEIYFNSAKSILDSLLGRKDARVDTVSGATYSSRAIINAVRAGLDQARKKGKTMEDEKSKEEPGKTEDDKVKEKENGKDKPESDKEKPNKEEKPKDKEEDSKEKDKDSEKGQESDDLSRLIRKGKLKDGEYIGHGAGYNTTAGKLEAKVIIENGKVVDIIRNDDQATYKDDWGVYKTVSANIIPYLKDPVDGKRNIALMKLHRDYVDEIIRAEDPSAKARELLGEKYSKNIIPTIDGLSPRVKWYLSEKYKAHKMFDSVSGATLSAGGTARAADDALAKSENDEKTGSNIDSLRVIYDKDNLIDENFYTHKAEILSNKYEPLDLSKLKIELISKYGEKEVISYANFKERGIEIVSEDGTLIEDKMEFSEEIKNKRVLNTSIVHKDSQRKVDLAIKFGNYSNDYVTKMEYSLDGGQNWIEIENPKKSEENPKNIGDNQEIKVAKDKEGSPIELRTITAKGKIFSYKTESKLKFDRIKFDAIDKSYEKNNNASFAVWLVVKEDKKKAQDEKENPNVEEKEEEAGAEDLYIDLAKEYLNYQEIKDLRVKTGKDVKLLSIDNLPKGLRLKGEVISGKIDLEDSFFENNYKNLSLSLHASKNGKKIKRDIEMNLFQDKDRDGINDNEEGEAGANKFTAIFRGVEYKDKCLYKELGDKSPSIEEYKSLFKNIPDDGSVEIEIIQEPKMDKVGPSIAKLSFKSKYVDGESITSVGVHVRNKTEESKDSDKKDESKGILDNIKDKLLGKKEDEEKDKDKDPGKDKPAEPHDKEEKEVDDESEDLEEDEDEDVDLDPSFEEYYINHQDIEDIEIDLPEGIEIVDIEGLPEGLSYENGKISGHLDVADEDFDDQAYKELDLRFALRKGEKEFEKNLKFMVYQDKDRDGISAMDEGTGADEIYNPSFESRYIYKNIGDEKPSLEEYKNLITNLPDDDSLSFEFLREPDMSQKGHNLVRIRIGSSHVEKSTVVTIAVIVS